MPPKRASRTKASSNSKDTDSQDVVMEDHTPAFAIASATEESNQNAADGDIMAIVKRSVKRTRELFAENQENIYSLLPSEDQPRCAFTGN
jgi:pleiotropic regulator 1